MKELSEELSSDIIGATIQAVEAQVGPSISWSVSTNCSSIQTCPAVPTITPLSVNVIKDAQTNDQDISPVYECKLSGTKPKVRQLKTYSLKTKCLFREWGKLTINQDVSSAEPLSPAHSWSCQRIIKEQSCRASRWNGPSRYRSYSLTHP